MIKYKYVVLFLLILIFNSSNVFAQETLSVDELLSLAQAGFPDNGNSHLSPLLIAHLPRLTSSITLVENSVKPQIILSIPIIDKAALETSILNEISFEQDLINVKIEDNNKLSQILGQWQYTLITFHTIKGLMEKTAFYTSTGIPDLLIKAELYNIEIGLKTRDYENSLEKLISFVGQPFELNYNIEFPINLPLPTLETLIASAIDNDYLLKKYELDLEYDHIVNKKHNILEEIQVFGAISSSDDQKILPKLHLTIPSYELGNGWTFRLFSAYSSNGSSLNADLSWTPAINFKYIKRHDNEVERIISERKRILEEKIKKYYYDYLDGLSKHQVYQRWLDLYQADSPNNVSTKEKLLDIKFQITINNINTLYSYWNLRLLTKEAF